MSIDFTKPVRTKSGKPVRILCTDRICMDKRPVAGLMRCYSQEYFATWTTEGKEYTCGSPSEDDLENVPEKVIKNVVWIKNANTLGRWELWGETSSKTTEEFIKKNKYTKEEFRVVTVEFDG